MSTTRTIEYEQFIALSGLDLCHYLEPLLTDPTAMVTEDVLKRLFSELPSYDEYHLVYALELGAERAPAMFVPSVPLYLEHEQGSVWSAASRILARLPCEYVTQDLVDSVRTILVRNSARTYIADILEQLEERLTDTKKQPKH